jgi:membrane protease YdiL (CAAX protease family)
METINSSIANKKKNAWAVIRVVVLQLILMSGILSNLIAIGILTVLVDKLHLFYLDFHGKTTNTICAEGKILGYLILFTVNLIIVILAWKYIEKKQLREMLLRFSRKQIKYLFIGILLGLLEVLTVFGILILLGKVKVEWGLSYISTKTAYMMIGWILASSIVAPLTEELLNRGYWFQNLKNVWNIKVAIITTSILFGLLHLANPNSSLLGAINITLTATAFCLGMLYTKSLWLPIGWHTSWNFFQFFLAGLPNSGISVSYLKLEGTTLFSSSLLSNDIISGGDFGMEGSIVETLFLSLVIITILWLIRNKTKTK